MPASIATSHLPQVDAYIGKAKPFAQPILAHLRDSVHRAVPEVEEAMKWSRPFFLYKGVILGNMAAFKEHCSFGLWGTEMAETLRESGVSASEGMGTFGRITSLQDLPPAAELEAHIGKAASLIGDGTRRKSIQRVAKAGRTKIEVPEGLLRALALRQHAAERFAAMSASCRREYAEWIAEAKREETRARRIATAVEWISEGKGRNWKHERPA